MIYISRASVIFFSLYFIVPIGDKVGSTMILQAPYDKLFWLHYGFGNHSCFEMTMVIILIFPS